MDSPSQGKSCYLLWLMVR